MADSPAESVASANGSTPQTNRFVRNNVFHKVILTGAAGRTGRLVYQRLKEMGEIVFVRALVQSMQSMERLGVSEEVYIGDVTRPETLAPAFIGMDTLIILTSAMPKLRPDPEGRQPEFYFDDGAYPEQVDWQGQVNQIDLDSVMCASAKEHGFKHVILVSSMGITRRDHPFNNLGNGNILVWKHKSEEYLRDSGLTYTIIRASLLDNAEGGQRELVVGKQDELLRGPYKRIPRADVAEVCVQALFHDESKNKAFDLAAKPVGEGTPTTDFQRFFRESSESF